jgi:hypothetical protein
MRCCRMRMGSRLHRLRREFEYGIILYHILRNGSGQKATVSHPIRRYVESYRARNKGIFF